jgi:hypothetical protein
MKFDDIYASICPQVCEVHWLYLYFPYSGEATTRMTQSSSPLFNSA